MSKQVSKFFINRMTERQAQIDDIYSINIKQKRHQQIIINY